MSTALPSTATATAPATPRALVYMTARNCERYLRAAIESVARQTHAGLHVLFVDDCSDDGTAATARQLLATRLPGRHSVVRNPEQWGKARNAHVHLREALPRGDFVAILDADDQLTRATVLAEMAAEYANGHDVVWTTFELDTGQLGGSRPLDPLQPPRTQGWRTSHFFSFRAELFANVPEHYLQDDSGNFFPAACDQAIAYPVLDQTRRYKFLPVRALRYTTGNPNSHHNLDTQGPHLGSRRQVACAEQVLAKPPLPCTRWALGERAGGDEALAALRDRLGADIRALGDKLGPATPQATATGAWSQAAAATLAQRCPALVDLMMDRRDPALPVADAWRLWRWLQATGRPPAVLELGAGPLAAPVQAMVQALGGRFVSASGEPARAQSLQARLADAGMTAEVCHAPWVEASLGGHTGHVPDLSALPSDARGFDVLLVSAAHLSAEPVDTMLALPLAVDRLDPAGFRVCVWAPDDPALRSGLARVWGELAPALKFSDQAFGGQALCVQPGASD